MVQGARELGVARGKVDFAGVMYAPVHPKATFVPLVCPDVEEVGGYVKTGFRIMTDNMQDVIDRDMEAPKSSGDESVNADPAKGVNFKKIVGAMSQG